MFKKLNLLIKHLFTADRSERWDSGYGSSHNESMNVMGALICVHRFEVHHMADYVVLVRDTVSAEHVSSISRDLESLAAIIPLGQTNHVG